MNLEPIATVHSPITEGVDEDWGSVVSEIELKPEFADGLRELDRFSHALIIFYMHQSSFKAESDLVRRPRGRADMPEAGIFAQRAKHRPNPIGITAVEIVGIERKTLRVRGLDAITARLSSTSSLTSRPLISATPLPYPTGWIGSCRAISKAGGFKNLSWPT